MAMKNRKNPPVNSRMIRESVIRSVVNEEARTVQLAWASEVPYTRWFGPEILQCDTESVRLERLQEMGVLLFNHDVNQVIGKVLSVQIDKDGVCRAEVQFDEDEESERIFQKVKSETLKGVSVGYVVHRWEYVGEDSKSSNGKFQGPCEVATDWEALEISIVSVPADPTVGVGRSFENGEEKNMKQKSKEELMKIKEETELLLRELEDEEEKEVDEEDKEEKELDDEEKEEKEVDEEDKDEKGKKSIPTRSTRTHEEITEITTVCEDHDLDLGAILKKGIGINQVRKLALNKKSKEARPVSGVRVEAERSQLFNKDITEAIMMRAGLRVENPSKEANRYRGASLMELAQEYFRNMENKHIIGREETVRSIFANGSSSGFLQVLANIANKGVLMGYEQAPTTFQEFTRKGVLTDYKEATRVGLGTFGVLERVPEGGEYQQATLSDTGAKIQLAKYGKTFNITREMILNDDLQAFSTIPLKMGMAARLTIEYLVYGMLLTGKAPDGVNLFDPTHSNIVTPGSALDVNGLSTARTMMRRQTEATADGTPNLISIVPKFLLVPPELETVADQLLASTVDPDRNNSTINPFYNKVTSICSPLLTDKKAWYLAADPTFNDTLEVAYLDGNEAPFIEEMEVSRNDSRTYKVRLEAGMAILDHKGFVKNLGQ